MLEAKFVVIHYGEIALKGNNRLYFEKKLIANIKRALLAFPLNIVRKHDKIILEFKKAFPLLKIQNILSKIPGITHFSFAVRTPLDLEEINKKALEIIQEENFSTFKINTRRSNKKFPSSSMEVNNVLGDLIRKKLKKKVLLTNPDLTFNVEIGEKEAFLYFEKIKGVGGLPVGSSGKAIGSLSGGIDSPVAAFLGMKRGLEVVLVHIFNRTLNESQALNKVEKLVRKISAFQGGAKLYVVPFFDIQKSIIANVPAGFRMIIYRRFMLEILNQIASIEKAGGIITGDSLGQVASQTLENLTCIYKASNLPVFAPLIGMNKVEIIDLAKKIDTYEDSILPYADCCSFMVSKHPQTKGNLKIVEEVERSINNKEKLICDSIKKAEIRQF